MLTPSLPWWDAWGSASCCTPSGHTRASCRLRHRPNPCARSASANAPVSPPLRGPPPTSSRCGGCRRYRPSHAAASQTTGPQPSHPPTPSCHRPVAAGRPSCRLGIPRLAGPWPPARPWPSPWRPMAAGAVSGLCRFLGGDAWPRLARPAGGRGAAGPWVGRSGRRRGPPGARPGVRGRAQDGAAVGGGGRGAAPRLCPPWPARRAPPAGPARCAVGPAQRGQGGGGQ